MKCNKNLFFLFIILIFTLSACRVSFSFTGGSVNPNAKTVYIPTFPNNSLLVNPSLSQVFTTALKDKVQSQTPLTLITAKNADYVFEGAITSYNITPIALQGSVAGNDVAAMNRLTISVRVTFKNKFDEKLNYDQTFSRYSDYASSLNFSSLESGLMQEIVDALTDDIFNKAFVNW
jgi:hypothetical protein